MKLWKVLNADGTPCHGGTGVWSLPSADGPGDWMPIDDPKPCKRGWHLCRRADLVCWLGPAIFEAEARGLLIESDNKVVAGEARLLRRVDAWDDRTARLFAADCAERVLPIFEAAHPGDGRPRLAIEAARAFANGQITAAASTAASVAAWDAARPVAGAALDAALDADCTAASAAARAAASDAASAARAAAWAARAAASAAVWGSERAWQTEHLHRILEGDTTWN